MSFSFDWQAFVKQEACQSNILGMLTDALNKQKPLILEDRIHVLNLDWGDEPPTLETLEIGDVAADRFRGVFKLQYDGGATITVATKVQANPLNMYANGAPVKFVMPEFVAAPVSLPIPLHLTLRKIRLQATVIVVFSKQGGLTLVFRNDPLQSIEVSSTFDQFATLASFLQQQIETQIRNLFREEVPSLLHQLSLKFMPSYNQAMLGLVAKPSKTPSEPISFACIDSENPVSQINFLHLQAMLRSRGTLALETPVMPTAIVRSELFSRAALRSSKQSQILSLESTDQDAYDELYAQIKHMHLRSNRKIKRRTIKLNKHTEPETSDSTVSPDTKELLDKRVVPKASSEPPVKSENLLSRLPPAAKVTVTSEHKKPEASMAPIPGIYSRRKDLVPGPRKHSTFYRRLPIHSLAGDVKFPGFTLGTSLRRVISASSPNWDPEASDVQDVDDLPPAYVA